MTPTWRQHMATWSEDLREAYEERAAIMEFDGGAPRELAEFMAFMRVCRMHVRRNNAHQQQHNSNTCHSEVGT